MAEPIAGTPPPPPPPPNANDPTNGTLTMQESIEQTKKAMGEAIATNAAITELTIRFQVAMQGINATREAATEAYKKAGEANNSMHQ